MSAGVLLNNWTAARRFYLAAGGLVLLAWGLLAAWQRSAYTELFGHEALEDGGILPAFHLAAFLLSWALMTLAMMLPLNLPAFARLVLPTRPRGQTRLRPAWVLLGYLAPWLLFGLLLYLGDSALHELAEPGAPLGAVAGFIAPAIVLVAGLYQFTPLKLHAMQRSQAQSGLKLPGAGELPDEPGGPGEPGAWPPGLLLGLACLGSCWPVMLLLFALGHHRLDGMLLVTGFLAAERLAPWGSRLVRWAGLALVAWAIFLAVAALP